MAYASLVSLSQTIDQLLLDDQYIIPSKLKKQIRSIHEHTVDFQTFLEDFPKKAIVLEGRIRDVANKAEDIIEYFMCVQIRSLHTLNDWVTPNPFVSRVLEKFNALSFLLLFMFINGMFVQNPSGFHVLKLLNIGIFQLLLFLFIMGMFMQNPFGFRVLKKMNDWIFRSLQFLFTRGMFMLHKLKEVTVEIYLIAGVLENFNALIFPLLFMFIIGLFVQNPFGFHVLQLLNIGIFQLLLFLFTMDMFTLHKLNEVTVEIDLIAGELVEIKNSSTIQHEQIDSDSSAAASSSSRLAPAHNDVIVGFDDDLMEIKSRLCGESSKLEVVPIFGMGGIGKTTLARNAYYDPLIMEYFHLRAWVTVSQDYSAEEIISNLRNSMESNLDGSGESNDEKVYRSLKGRRYLIVMDDMWSTNAWDIVRNILPDDNNGSRIMLTTRLSDVAAYPDPCSPLYEMCLMDEDQSWNLLRQRVFVHQDCPPELEDTGKEIARSCRGLPLAIVVTAGFLSTVSRNPASWLEIADNLNSVDAGKDGQVEEILSLSYTHLPHHLRPCFLYMGGFPEDREVRVSKLIKLWVAEGFLKCQNGSKSFEEEAGECLENLVKRSLVLVKRRKSNGKIKSCSLHDLVRDMCIRKASEEKFLVNSRNYAENELSNQRRMSIFPPGPLPFLSTTYGSTIRTVMWFLYTPLPSLRTVKLVRVLDAGDADVESLPIELFELFHLRYIAINYHRKIPAAISKLQNLQTLIIRARGRWRFEANHDDCLPQQIWRMPQLRHLIFYGALPNLEGTSSSLGTLNLQTLLFSLTYDMSTGGILKTIPNLKKLVINCHDRQGGFNLNGLVCLHQLQNLTLRSYSIHAVWRKDYFTFPTMLRKLTLSGFRLSWDDVTAICSLPNLEVLKLRDFACRGSTWDATIGEFPKLEYLLIEESYLEEWITGSCHFPRLKFLLIHDCWRLSEIPDGIGEIPTLEVIEVKGRVKKSLVESAEKILEEQQSWGNDLLQVRCMTQ